MSDVSANPQDAGVNPDDDQGLAERLDDEELGMTDTATGEVGSVASDHPLASMEATSVLGTGDVPADSVRERAWREEPEGAAAPDDDRDISGEEAAMHVVDGD